MVKKQAIPAAKKRLAPKKGLKRRQKDLPFEEGAETPPAKVAAPPKAPLHADAPPTEAPAEADLPFIPALRKAAKESAITQSDKTLTGSLSTTRRVKTSKG